jgi:hypothetical protein
MPAMARVLLDPYELATQGAEPPELAATDARSVGRVVFVRSKRQDHENLWRNSASTIIYFIKSSP